MGWWIALAVIIALAVLPLGISARYDENGPLLRLIIGPVRWTLYPSKRKKKKKVTPEGGAPEGPANAPAGEKPKGGSVTDFFPLVQRVLDFLGDLRRKLRVNLLELNVVLAGDDPCDLAVNYGRTMAAVASLDPQLERFFVIKRKGVWVGCDFTADKTLILARLDLTITIGRIFSLGIRHGIRILREFLNIMKLRKGGALQ